MHPLRHEGSLGGVGVQAMQSGEPAEPEPVPVSRDRVHRSAPDDRAHGRVGVAAKL